MIVEVDEIEAPSSLNLGIVKCVDVDRSCGFGPRQNHIPDCPWYVQKIQVAQSERGVSIERVHDNRGFDNFSENREGWVVVHHE